MGSCIGSCLQFINVMQSSRVIHNSSINTVNTERISMSVEGSEAGSTQEKELSEEEEEAEPTPISNHQEAMAYIGEIEEDDIEELEEMRQLSEEEEEAEPTPISNHQEAMAYIGEIEEEVLEELGDMRKMLTELHELLKTEEQQQCEQETFLMRARWLIREGSRNAMSMGDIVESLALAVEMEQQADE